MTRATSAPSAASTVVSLRCWVMSCPPQGVSVEPDVDGGRYQRDEEQDRVQRRALAVLELLERQVVAPGGQQLGGVGRAALGQPDDHVEDLDREHEPEHEYDLDDRADDRERDPEQSLHAVGAVQHGRFLQLDRNVLQRAEQQHGKERDADPDVGDEDGDGGPDRRGQEADRGADQADVTQDLVDRTRLGLEQELEDETGDEQGQQPRDDDQRAGELAERELQVEQQGQAEPDHELEQQRQDREAERPDDSALGGGLLQRDLVVLDASERGEQNADGGRSGLLEAQDQVVDDRDQKREQYIEDRGDQEPQSGPAGPGLGSAHLGDPRSGFCRWDRRPGRVSASVLATSGHSPA